MTKQVDPSAIAGPSWDNSSEYKGFDDPQLTKDQDQVANFIKSINEKSQPIVEALQSGNINEASCCNAAQEITKIRQQATVLNSNMYVYASCCLSVDATDRDGKELFNKAQSLLSQTAIALEPLSQWLTKIDQNTLEQYLEAPHAREAAYQITRQREFSVYSLSLNEETLIKNLEINGLTAWGNLYDDLSGTIKCNIMVDGKPHSEEGLAKAASLLESPDRKIREGAFKGIEDGWTKHQNSCAAILNSMAGWRLDLYKRRSHAKELAYLTPPLHKAGIQRETLDSMFHAVKEGQGVAQSVLKTQAEVLNIDRCAPWDLFCPAPSEGEPTIFTYDEGLAVIKDAFGRISPEMADFVTLMDQNRWIEGTRGDRKRPGAYCTKFMKSRTPRVYMTYSGGMKDLITLAHELGHAFHNWVMKDLPADQVRYPMTLAETASIFCQAALIDHLTETNPDKVGDILWMDGREAEAFLLNIPARFEFEKKLYERRREGLLTPEDLDQAMTQSWTSWYGDQLSEMPKKFWMTKLHFYIAGLTFYNFPYTFGYLFSLGVYGQRKHQGEQFFENYKNLLRDTGVMSAEALAQKHLDADLTRPDFWRQSIETVSEKVQIFSKHFARG